MVSVNLSFEIICKYICTNLVGLLAKADVEIQVITLLPSSGAVQSAGMPPLCWKDVRKRGPRQTQTRTHHLPLVYLSLILSQVGVIRKQWQLSFWDDLQWALSGCGMIIVMGEFEVESEWEKLLHPWGLYASVHWCHLPAIQSDRVPNKQAYEPRWMWHAAINTYCMPSEQSALYNSVYEICVVLSH